MKVLELAQFFPPMIGGEERHVFNLSRELASRGHEVHVATLALPGVQPTESGGVVVHRLDSAVQKAGWLHADAERPNVPPVPDPVLAADLARLARRLRPDVVHAHDWIVNSYLPVKERVGAPLVYTLHDYGHRCTTRRFLMDGSVCPGASFSRCVSCAGQHYDRVRGPVLATAVRAGVPWRERAVDMFLPVSRAVAEASGLSSSSRARWTVVPNFIPDSLCEPAERLRFRAAPGDALPDAPFFFYAGDLSGQKGVPTLLYAYDRLPAEGRPSLLLVGRHAGEDIGPLPKGARIEAGWPHDLVMTGFARCLAAVAPSAWADPCPTTVLEALAAGAPLITTGQGGIADMVSDGSSALIVEPGNPARLAEAMSLVAQDPVLRDRLAQGGRREVRRFMASTVVDQIEALYRDLVYKTREVA